MICGIWYAQEGSGLPTQRKNWFRRPCNMYSSTNPDQKSHKDYTNGTYSNTLRSQTLDKSKLEMHLHILKPWQSTRKNEGKNPMNLKGIAYISSNIRRVSCLYGCNFYYLLTNLLTYLIGKQMGRGNEWWLAKIEA